MDKKSIGGIAALIIFLVLWQFVLIPMIPEDQLYKDAPQTPQSSQLSEDTEAPMTSSSVQKSQSEEQISQPKAEPIAPVVIIPEKVVELETDIFHVRFSNAGGKLIHLALLDFHPEAGSMDELLLVDLPSLGFGEKAMAHEIKTEGDTQVVTFRGQKAQIEYRFRKGSHFFDMVIKTMDGSQNAQFLFGNVSDQLSGKANNLARTNAGGIYALKSRDYGENSEIFLVESLKTAPFEKAIASSDLSWSGWRGKYFAWLIHPTEVNKAGHQLDYYHDGKAAQLKINTNGQSVLQYRMYAGPIDKAVLYPVNKELYMPLFNYTGIDIVIHFLLWLLDIYNSIPGINMGFAIIMLTITVKLILFPLTLKSQTSMFMMSKLGPKIKELQEKYKNDRQMLGVKQMEMFKENGVNPLSGCLPMFIQMPVFISLFSTIGEGFELRQAGFLGWISDLSAPDRFSILEMGIPLVGNGDGTTNLNLLPFLYIITMFIQQSLMPKSTDPQQQQMQKMMKFIMMGFAVILYNYSSGLMLYFVGSNILGMTESWYIRNKVMPKLEAKIKS